MTPGVSVEKPVLFPGFWVLNSVIELVGIAFVSMKWPVRGSGHFYALKSEAKPRTHRCMRSPTPGQPLVNVENSRCSEAPLGSVPQPEVVSCGLGKATLVNAD